MKKSEFLFFKLGKGSNTMKVKKAGALLLTMAIAASTVATGAPLPTFAAETFSGQLTKVDSAVANGNVVELSFNDGAVEGRITFLEDGIFRYNVDPTGNFSEYATPRSSSLMIRIYIRIQMLQQKILGQYLKSVQMGQKLYLIRQQQK